MFVYEKKLQYPVRIQNTNPKLAALIISQYGGPDGELGASLRYLSQRYAMPYDEGKAILTDIGTSVSVGAPFELSAPPNPRKTGQVCLSAAPLDCCARFLKYEIPAEWRCSFAPNSVI